MGHWQVHQLCIVFSVHLMLTLICRCSSLSDSLQRAHQMQRSRGILCAAWVGAGSHCRPALWLFPAPAEPPGSSPQMCGRGAPYAPLHTVYNSARHMRKHQVLNPAKLGVCARQWQHLSTAPGQPPGNAAAVWRCLRSGLACAARCQHAWPSAPLPPWQPLSAPLQPVHAVRNHLFCVPVLEQQMMIRHRNGLSLAVCHAVICLTWPGAADASGRADDLNLLPRGHAACESHELQDTISVTRHTLRAASRSACAARMESLSAFSLRTVSVSRRPGLVMDGGCFLACMCLS